MSLRSQLRPKHIARTLTFVLALSLAALLPVAAPAVAKTRPTPGPTTTWQYLPGVQADLYLPAAHLPAIRPRATRPRGVPVVVLVPGGGWVSADRTGLGQLAAAFAENGVAAINATYRIGQASSTFPVPVQDISCAVDAAVAEVRSRGLQPGPVVLLGHSSGAHLSSLAAFGKQAFRSPRCPYPPSHLDGWVGLSGIYDLRLVGNFAVPMMGGTAAQDPDAYTRAATGTYLAASGRPRLQILLVHGETDEVIPSIVSVNFADLTRQHGYRTQLTLVPGADHQAAYQAPVVAGIVLNWLARLR